MIHAVTENAASVWYVQAELYDDFMWTFDMEVSSDWESLTHLPCAH